MRLRTIQKAPIILAKALFSRGQRDRLKVDIHNKLLSNGFGSQFLDPKLVEFTGADRPSPRAIGDHICTIFADAVCQRPSLIVELGTRGGESTRALLAAAYYCRSTVLSVDIDPRPDLALPEDVPWQFVQSDDVEFGQRHFGEWCDTRGLTPKIDLLFIDTSHHYDHTVREIDTWFRFLADDATVLFHDTNMARRFRRLDNSIGCGWDNDRGVIRAIEEFFDKRFDETKAFVDISGGWLIRHHPYSSGLTLLKRIQAS